MITSAKIIIVVLLLSGCATTSSERMPNSHDTGRDLRVCLQNILAGIMGAGFANGICNENEYTKGDDL